MTRPDVQTRVLAFLGEYRELCVRHGLMLDADETSSARPMITEASPEDVAAYIDEVLESGFCPKMGAV